MGSWDILHINFIEDMRKEFHSMIVIDSHEFVVLFLIDFVTDGFTIDDSDHAV